MIVLIYFLAAVVQFFAGTIATWIPLAIMHRNSGNRNSLWQPDPGNEERFYRVHNLGQAAGAFVAVVAILCSVLWVFSWFGRQPHVVFLLALSAWEVGSKRWAKEAYRPVAQRNGAALGVLLFFICYYRL